MTIAPPLVLLVEDFDDARERAMAAGADGFIGKPCLPDELTRHILSVLRKEQRSDV